jgi:hypothetical protein
MENEVAELQCKLRKMEEYQVHFHEFIDIYMNKALEHYEPHFYLETIHLEHSFL